MLAYSEPGVRLTRTPIDLAAQALPMAMPLFVGYTPKGAPSRVYEIASLAAFDAQLGQPASSPAWPFALYDTVRHYFEQGGGRCYVLSLGAYADARPELDDVLRAVPWTACWSEAPLATLLVVPDLVLLDGEGADAVQRWVRAWQVLLSAPAREARAFVVLDGPDDPTQVSQCLEQLAQSGLGDALSHAALYWPRLQTDRVHADTPIVVPSSGAIAAVMQRTDRERGVWHAPANVALARVVRPTHDAMPSLPQGMALNRIRSFAARGVRVWGCRTLAPVLAGNANTPWQYVQLRRTVNYVEQHLRELARFAVFEPNHAVTWLKLKSVARAWLRRLWLAGGLLGAQEGDAFWLRIGLHESMTPDDVSAGRMRLHVGLALQWPAQFIELQLQLQTGEPAMDSLALATSDRSAVSLSSEKA